jgi:predicted metal-dependent enzyme (double-stranded beta helix superfamily)
MYTIDDLVRELRAADGPGGMAAMKDAMARAVSHQPLPADPSRSQVLYDGPGLMILHTAVDAGFSSPPHDHRTWAVIGVYHGQEDNTFYRLVDDTRVIAEAGGRSLNEGEVLTLGPEAIHKIANPRNDKLLALHVYGVNILKNERSAWDLAAMREYPFEVKIDRAGGFDNRPK